MQYKFEFKVRSYMRGNKDYVWEETQVRMFIFFGQLKIKLLDGGISLSISKAGIFMLKNIISPVF